MKYRFLHLVDVGKDPIDKVKAEVVVYGLLRCLILGLLHYIVMRYFNLWEKWRHLVVYSVIVFPWYFVYLALKTDSSKYKEEKVPKPTAAD